MIDELFFKAGFAKQKLNYIFFGFLITIAGFFTSFILFKADSLATLLVITMLLMPVLMRLFQKEEKIVRDKRIKHILRNHKSVFESYFFLFIGIFFAFLVLQLVTIHNQEFFATAFEFQTNWVVNHQESLGVVDVGVKEVLGNAFLSDLLILIFGFLFSFVYGSGGIFLIVAAASILSTFLIYLMRFFESFLGFGTFLLITFFLYIVPQVFVFIIASTAGGVLSKGVISEKITGKHFKNVLNDATRLFVYAVLLLVIVNVIRSFVSYAFLK